MPAGSAPGERRGGRAKGTPNKRTLIIPQVARDRVQSSFAHKVSPLEVLLEQMHWYRERAAELTEKISELTVNVTDPDSLKAFLKALQEMGQFRQNARVCAAEAAPYVHARLATIDFKPAPDDSEMKIIDGRLTLKDAGAVYQETVRRAETPA